jgi:DNA replication and repair protein RecF
MWVRHLALTQYRNYRRQELDLDRGVTVLLGDNAQGKSNLLEAVLLLATTRSERAQTDAELIGWDALGEPQPVARVEALVERRDGPLELQVIVVGRPGAGREGRLGASKRLRVNGVPRRAVDVVGQLTAVLFTTDDMELISGAPAGRRRFLDVMLSQIEPPYVRARQQYEKVVTRRNALLRRIQSGDAGEDELSFWDAGLAREGALLTRERAAAVAVLARHARDAHAGLSGGLEELSVAYQPRLLGWDAARVLKKQQDLERALADAMAASRPRDIGAGMTLTGPHRDDLSLSLNGQPAPSFASRGQQRTAALALRLAEARFMADRTGDLPVVLLDDVLSELDEGRRRAVLESLGGWDQLIITSADADRFDEGLPADTKVVRVRAGTIVAA